MRYLRIATISLLVVFTAVSVYESLDSLTGFPVVQGNSIPFITLIAAALVATHAWASIGWWNTFVLFALTSIVSLLFESIGVGTGLIYGPYHYTDQLGPRFLGLVPFVIPLAWFMISYPSLVIARSILGGRSAETRWHNLRVATLAAVVMTACDLVLDPILVRMGFWVWEVDGAYFGIPAHNYLGWLVTTFSIYILYQGISRHQAHRVRKTPNQSHVLLTSGSYGSSVAGNMLAALQMGLVGPALIGLFGAGAFALLSLINLNGGQRPAKD